MKIRAILIILLSLVFSNNTNSNSNYNENKYYVVFYVYKQNLSEHILTGHIFVGFERKIGADTYRDGKYGFIPKNDISKEDFFKEKPVDGQLISEESTPVDEQYKVKVSEQEYREGLKIVSEWTNATMQYIGLNNDCISFAQDISKSIKLVVPKRGQLQLPEQYLDELRRKNLIRIID